MGCGQWGARHSGCHCLVCRGSACRDPSIAKCIHRSDAFQFLSGAGAWLSGCVWDRSVLWEWLCRGNAAGKGRFLGWEGCSLGTRCEAQMSTGGCGCTQGCGGIGIGGVPGEPHRTWLGLSCWMLGCLSAPHGDAGGRYLGAFTFLFQSKEGRCGLCCVAKRWPWPWPWP